LIKNVAFRPRGPALQKIWVPNFCCILERPGAGSRMQPITKALIVAVLLIAADQIWFQGRYRSQLLNEVNTFGISSGKWPICFERASVPRDLSPGQSPRYFLPFCRTAGFGGLGLLERVPVI
jgi:hypothetical protein